MTLCIGNFKRRRRRAKLREEYELIPSLMGIHYSRKQKAALHYYMNPHQKKNLHYLSNWILFLSKYV